MRTEELVSRADQKIDIERLDVDRTMRTIVHGIHPHLRPRGMRESRDPRQVVDGAERIRGIAHCHEARAWGEQPLEGLEIERPLLGGEWDAPHYNPSLGEV